MARCYTKHDELESANRPVSGPVSLARLIRRQPPGRRVHDVKKGNRVWRPMQLSDFGYDEAADYDDASELGETTSLCDVLSDNVVSEASAADAPIRGDGGLSAMNATSPVYARRSMCNLPQLRDDALQNVSEEYVRGFGKQLPDPIHLSTEIGAFDGEVIFIAHPNRDISAYQWSASSFQWVNIGLYSHNRRKIEGSLAAERIRNSTAALNTVTYFRAVAEQRQQEYLLASAPHSLGPANISSSDYESGSGTDEKAQQASTAYVSGLTAARPHTFYQATKSSEPSTPAPHTIVREPLDDPFVTPARNPGEGSMDFAYEFPTRPRIPMIHRGVIAHSQGTHLGVSHHREINEGLYAPRSSGARHAETGTPLYEVAARSSLLTSPFVPASPEKTLKSAQQRYPQRCPIDNGRLTGYQIARAFGRAVSQGPTVAKPNRVLSVLNANAPAYTRMPMLQQGKRESAGCDLAASNNILAASLKFSDPDTVRTAQNHEIVNGILSATTPQNFKGPFFADPMPTTQNPTAPFACQMEEETKLKNWFHDGQRPARQQDFSKSIIMSAIASAKSGSSRSRGIYAACSTDPLQYVNTAIYVRLYENLSGYAEQARSRGPRDFFTRAWRPAPSHMRDLGPNGNKSFFEKQTQLVPS